MADHTGVREQGRQSGAAARKTKAPSRLTFPMKSSGGARIALPDLPWAEDALAPVISGETIEYHYGKHHRKYVDTASKLIEGTPYADMPLERIVIETAKDASKSAIFNNAAQSWNHWFYWMSMNPHGGGRPGGALARKIDEDFGDFDSFAGELKQAATGQFGSGWAWVVRDKGKLKVMKTSNADTPIAHGITPLLALDVWEHAYYLDYQNRRPDYVDAVIERLLDWEFAEQNLSSA
jgi:Fe-Mn family superoxide dismutase